MLVQRFKTLLEEMKKYQEDSSNERIQKWELTSVCQEIILTVAKMRKEDIKYEMTENELENFEWAYAYLIAK